MTEADLGACPFSSDWYYKTTGNVWSGLKGKLTLNDKPCMGKRCEIFNDKTGHCSLKKGVEKE